MQRMQCQGAARPLGAWSTMRDVGGAQAQKTSSPGRKGGHSRSSPGVYAFCSANHLRNKEALLPASQGEGGVPRNPRRSAHFRRGRAGRLLLMAGSVVGWFRGAPTFQTCRTTTRTRQAAVHGESKAHRRRKPLVAIVFSHTERL